MDVIALASGILHFVMFAAGGYLLLRLTWTHQGTILFQQRLFLSAIAIRFAASLIIYEGGLLNTLKDEDSSGWVVGEAHQKDWETKGYSGLEAPWLFLEAYKGSHKGYYYLLGALFLITGLPGRLAAAALNCFFGAWTVLLVYRLARSLFSEVVARRSAWLACFFPSLIVWSAQTLKEPVVIFLETLALYSCIRLRVSGFTTRHIVLTGLAILLLYPFRFYAAYLAVGTVVMTLLLPQFGTGRTNFRSAFAVVGMIAAFIVFSGAQVTKEVQLNSFDLKYIETFKEFSVRDQGSGVKVEVDLHTSAGLGYSLFVGVMHLLMAPFPWQWSGSLRMLLVIPEVLIWWVILFLGVVPGLRYCVRNRLYDVLPLLLFITGMGLLYSLLFANIGLVYRQRTQLLPWLLIFGAIGIELRLLARSAVVPQRAAGS